MKILINAGPTREIIDPVRFITIHSTGKMGYALAAAAVKAGHEVTLVSGPVVLTPPAGLKKLIRIVTAAEMAEAMKQAFPAADLTILCAAVADYRPKFYSASKLKKPGQLLAGFAAETDDVEQNARKKLTEKKFDWIAANRVGIPGSGFGSDTNTVKLYAADGSMTDLGTGLKTELADRLIRIFTAGK